MDRDYLYLQLAGGAEAWCAVVSSDHSEDVFSSLRPSQRGSSSQLATGRVKGETLCSGACRGCKRYGHQLKVKLNGKCFLCRNALT